MFLFLNSYMKGKTSACVTDRGRRIHFLCSREAPRLKRGRAKGAEARLLD